MHTISFNYNILTFVFPAVALRLQIWCLWSCRVLLL